MSNDYSIINQNVWMMNEHLARLATLADFRGMFECDMESITGRVITARGYPVHRVFTEKYPDKSSEYLSKNLWQRWLKQECFS